MHVSPSNKRYIGITKVRIEDRWRNGKGYIHNQYFTRAIEKYIGMTGQLVEERWQGGKNYRTCIAFNRAIQKYGWDNFEHIIIAKGLTEDEAKWLEIELIREWDSTNRDKGYNISLGGEGTNGWTPSKETRQKMSENHADFNGKNNPNFGKSRSEETKQKLREKNGRRIILLNTKEIFLSIKEGAEKYNVSQANIFKCCKGKVKSVGKSKDGVPLVWMFYDKYLQTTEEEVQRKLRDADKRVILLNTNEIFLTTIEGAIRYNTQQNNITNCCKGKLKSAGRHPTTNEPLVWMYYKDYLKLIKEMEI